MIASSKVRIIQKYVSQCRLQILKYVITAWLKSTFNIRMVDSALMLLTSFNLMFVTFMGRNTTICGCNLMISCTKDTILYCIHIAFAMDHWLHYILCTVTLNIVVKVFEYFAWIVLSSVISYFFKLFY